MRKLKIILSIAALLAAFLAGLWPQWSARRAAQREAAAARAALEEAQQRLRLCELRRRLLDVVAAAQAHNLGIAAQHAQGFLAELEAFGAGATPSARAVVERIRPRTKELADIAQRLDPQVPEELSRVASELTTLLAELEQPAPSPAATPR